MDTFPPFLYHSCTKTKKKQQQKKKTHKKRKEIKRNKHKKTSKTNNSFPYKEGDVMCISNTYSSCPLTHYDPLLGNSPNRRKPTPCMTTGK